MLSEHQLSVRKGRISASLSSAIAGAGRFGLTPLKAYRLILQLEESLLDADSIASRKGHIVEPLIIEEAAKRFGIAWTKNNETKTYGDWLCATADAFCSETQMGLEVKNVEYNWDKWGSESDNPYNAIPVNYLYQCLTCMIVYNVNCWHLAAMSRYEIRCWRIDATHEQLKEWREAMHAWYVRHIVARVPPAAETLEELPDFFTDPKNTYVDLSDRADLIYSCERFETLKNEIIEREKEKDEHEFKIKSAMGNNEYAKCDIYDLTWKQSKRSRIFKLKREYNQEYQDENE